MFSIQLLMKVKSIVRDKKYISWTLLLPIALSLVVYFAFSDIGKGDSFDSIPVAVVENVPEDDGFYQALVAMESASGTRIFSADKYSFHVAKEKLKAQKVIAVIVMGKKMELYFNQMGVEEMIVKNFVEHYSKTQTNELSFVRNSEIESTKQHSVFYYYVILAIMCGFSWIAGIKTVAGMEGSCSVLGARLQISPIPKWRLFLLNALAALAVQFSEIGIVLFLMSYVFGAFYQNQILLLIQLCSMASIVGFLIGLITQVYLIRRKKMKK
ncbi:ABC transporter permease [Anaeromicropila populeti]|uniref:ABC-2 type transporter transmembrane domain-containing protein n=1 Tax=Anaeromicropila populeti TaxID=37658 RepID=A0A1I6KR08_9FIRM|nr:ABC transporter permease [Anaeromicropila populeti]SFR93685.1 hypothetical protein SAMN05661086_02607 [Anaeromicropila populeti]